MGGGGVGGGVQLVELLVVLVALQLGSPVKVRRVGWDIVPLVLVATAPRAAAAPLESAPLDAVAALAAALAAALTATSLASALASSSITTALTAASFAPASFPAAT